MSRNHYGGVRSKTDAEAQKAKKIEEERNQLLKQNQELIESIKIRDRVIEDLLNKVPNTISEGIIEVLGEFTDRLEKSLKNIHISGGTDVYTSGQKKEQEVFINPMDSSIELEKSFNNLGEESSSEAGAEEKKKRLKEILGGNK